MAAQTCLQSCLPVVYQELLDYDEDEIYFQKEPALTGKTFTEALFLFETSNVVGLKPEEEQAILNPTMNRCREY